MFLTNFYNKIKNLFRFFFKSKTEPSGDGQLSLLCETLIIWDVENIPYSHFEYIEKFINFIPESVFIVSQQNLSKKEQDFFESKGFSCIVSNEIADLKIIDMIKSNQERFNNLVLVSSDSDFTPIIKEMVNLRKNVFSVSNHYINKRLRMKLPLGKSNLKVYSYDPAVKTSKKNTAKKIQQANGVTLTPLNNLNSSKVHKCDICDSILSNPKNEIRDIYYNSLVGVWIKKPLCAVCAEDLDNEYGSDELDEQLYLEHKKNIKLDIEVA